MSRVLKIIGAVPLSRQACVGIVNSVGAFISIILIDKKHIVWLNALIFLLVSIVSRNAGSTWKKCLTSDS